MSRKCQVCGDRIVDGKCVSCGMPYRNDDELYHLNENKAEHYAHATRSARQQMDQNEIPLPDRRKASAYKGTSARPSSRTGYGASSSRKEGKKKTSPVAIWLFIVILYIIVSWFLSD